MGIEFSSGSLFIQKDDATEYLGTCLSFVPEVPEICVSENVPLITRTNVAEFSYDMKVDAKVLNYIMYDKPTNVNYIYFNVPIMIQARWHKKPRIRKKWLKRYGMKRDVVKVEADAIEITPNIPNSYEIYREDGILSNWNSYEFCAGNIKYVLKPDQKRRGIKIEW